MRKKLLSVVVAMSLVIVTTASYPSQIVYAEEEAEASAYATGIDTELLKTALDDITIAGEAWESIGFSSEDIAELTQLERKDASFYEGYTEQIAALSVETEQTRSLENELLNQAHAVPYAQDGNPPESAQEQNERLAYVTNVALSRYGNKSNFGQYIYYLYMSHYIDNPNYTKDNPGFNSIYAYIITQNDITVYDLFASESKMSIFANNVRNLYDDLGEAKEKLEEFKELAKTGKDISVNTADTVQDLLEYDPQVAIEHAKLIKTSLVNHYDTAESVSELLTAIHDDLRPAEVSEEFTNACVTGIMGLLATTTPLFSFGLSVSLCYFDLYMNLYDRARLVALHTTLSGRIADRVDFLIWGE